MNQPPSSSRLSALTTYASRVQAFSPNARLYLLFVLISGAALGVFRLLFNFYVLSLGFDQALLGQLITVNSGIALLAAIPIGYLADRIGRKRSLLLGSFVVSGVIAGMVAWPTVFMFYVMNGCMGLAQSLMGVTTAPFLMENSQEDERTYLFSFAFGLQTLSGFVGNLAGGYLPTWIGEWLKVDATSSTAYGWSLGAIAAISLLSLFPILILRRQHRAGEGGRSMFAPFSYFKTHSKELTRLILPMFVTAIGAGMVMPFMNVFYKQVHHQPDPVIGNLFAWGALAMGIGLLLAPMLAERMGNIQMVVVTQALSIPFLVVLGFAPWFWASAAAYYIRATLMNMSNPVYQAFVMEHVDAKSRATVASLVSMAWNFGWAFSPSISGDLQVSYGFNIPFLVTIVLYILSVYLYWVFFWPRIRKAVPVVTGD